MSKQEILSNYSLKQASFDEKSSRKAMTTKELATLKALCKTKTFGLVSLIDDIDNIATFNGDYDCKLAQSGNAKQHTLISIWSRNAISHKTKKADYRDFGVRFHVAKLEELCKSEEFKNSIKERNVQIYSHKDGLEVRFTFESLSDCLKFVADIAQHSTAQQETTQEQEKSTAQQEKSTKSKSTANKSKSTKSKSKKA